MIELDVGPWEPHTLEATGTTLPEWRTSVRPLGGHTLQVLVPVFVFLAMPVFAEDGAQPLAPMIWFALIMSAPTMWCVYWAYKHCQFDIVGVSNDNAEAGSQFLAALRHADKELLIHDDGDKVDGSVYDNESIIQQIRDRLNKYPGLRIRCLLNFDEGVKVTDLSGEFGERFQVRYLHRRPVGDVHFKIADGGKWAYLSTHGKGEVEREGEVCDGRRASKRVRQYHVGDLVKEFNMGFDEARSQ